MYSIVTYETTDDKPEHYFLGPSDTKFFIENKIETFPITVPTAGGYDSKDIDANFVDIKYISEQSYEECLFVSNDGDFFTFLKKMKRFKKKFTDVSIDRPLYKVVGSNQSVKEYNEQFKQNNDYFSGLCCWFTKEDAVDDLSQIWRKKRYKSANLVEFHMDKQVKFVKLCENNNFTNDELKNKILENYCGVVDDDSVTIHHNKVNSAIINEKIIEVYNRPSYLI